MPNGAATVRAAAGPGRIPGRRVGQTSDDVKAVIFDASAGAKHGHGLSSAQARSAIAHAS